MYWRKIVEKWLLLTQVLGRLRDHRPNRVIEGEVGVPDSGDYVGRRFRLTFGVEWPAKDGVI
jgi:hypothetical protein